MPSDDGEECAAVDLESHENGRACHSRGTALPSTSFMDGQAGSVLDGLELMGLEHDCRSEAG